MFASQFSSEELPSQIQPILRYRPKDKSFNTVLFVYVRTKHRLTISSLEVISRLVPGKVCLPHYFHTIRLPRTTLSKPQHARIASACAREAQTENVVCDRLFVWPLSLNSTGPTPTPTRTSSPTSARGSSRGSRRGSPCRCRCPCPCRSREI